VGGLLFCWGHRLLLASPQAARLGPVSSGPRREWRSKHFHMSHGWSATSALR